ncbi:MAG: hypothetical protein K9G76_10840 [Bacteroidales bacterium]|nr:hypothetical protein [Bacteroidales bacterium]MCF8404266.1 hypothetical protein [Bacteroidales bacterium]
MNKEIYLKVLLLDEEEDWEAAHKLIQNYNTKEACWIHAYLHRKEGDLGNAGYWYRRAGKNIPSFSLSHEWAVLLKYIKEL